MAQLDNVVKRKRGRPPKEGSLSNKITSTMNISVNTSSDLNSPTAEHNSNQMVKRGAPDISTPLMKVSPRPRKKLRKGSTASVLLSASEMSPPSMAASAAAAYNHHPVANLTAYAPNQNFLVTPLQLAISGSVLTPYSQINLRTLDNISMITHDHLFNAQLAALAMFPVGGGAGTASLQPGGGHTAMSMPAHLPVYHTPPLSASMKSQFASSNAYWNSPGFLNTPATLSAHRADPISFMPAPSPAEFPTPTPSQSQKRASGSAVSPRTRAGARDLLPAALIVGRSPKKARRVQQQKQQQQQEQQQQQQHHIQQIQQQNQHQQTAMAAAVRFASTGPPARVAVPQRLPQQLQPQQQTAQPATPAAGQTDLTPVQSDDFILKLMVDDSGKAILSDDMFGASVMPKPKLAHAHTVIGITAIAGGDGASNTQQEFTELKRTSSDLGAKANANHDDLNLAPSKSITSTGSFESLGSSVSSGTGSVSSHIEELPSSVLNDPTTPKLKDSYLLSSTHTGFTPNINLAYNLTPQFNSMMYSMITMNSPQILANGRAAAAINGAQLFTEVSTATKTMDSDVGETVNFSDLMNLPPAANSNYKANIQAKMSNGSATSSTGSGSSTLAQFSASSLSPFPLNFTTGGDLVQDESGDARLALRKIIYIKRDR